MLNKQKVFKIWKLSCQTLFTLPELFVASSIKTYLKMSKHRTSLILLN